MKRMARLLLLFVVVLWFPWKAVCDSAHHLFFVERSKNRNIVQYDFRPMDEGNSNRKGPVVVYWVLENGEKRELSRIQRELAYGIASQTKLANDRYEIVLTAFKDRKIILKRTDGGYKAFARIEGREAILEKIYVECRESWAGLPEVLFLDVFGRDQQTNLPMTERVFPE